MAESLSPSNEPSAQDAPEPIESAAELQDEGAGGQEHPKGTLFLMLLFLIFIIAVWGYVYLTMLARS
jgi:hypothetical protein